MDELSADQDRVVRPQPGRDKLRRVGGMAPLDDPIAQARKEALWAGVLAMADRLGKLNAAGGKARGPANWDNEADPFEVSTDMDAGLPDGNRLRWVVTLRVEQDLDPQDRFWSEKLRPDIAQRAVRVNGKHFLLGKGDRTGSMAGFGGHEFEIRFHDGREVTTGNLWFQGVIPPAWRERLPDNAVFDPPGSGPWGA